ncbi:MAG: hypothetical protein WKG07_24760 [Hymenobacter sp.]
MPLAAALRYELGAGCHHGPRQGSIPAPGVAAARAAQCPPTPARPLLSCCRRWWRAPWWWRWSLRCLAAAAASGRGRRHPRLPLLVGGVLLVAAVRLLGLVLADVLYFLVDPAFAPPHDDPPLILLAGH